MEIFFSFFPIFPFLSLIFFNRLIVHQKHEFSRSILCQAVQESYISLSKLVSSVAKESRRAAFSSSRAKGVTENLCELYRRYCKLISNCLSQKGKKQNKPWKVDDLATNTDAPWNHSRKAPQLSVHHTLSWRL